MDCLSFFSYVLTLINDLDLNLVPQKILDS